MWGQVKLLAITNGLQKRLIWVDWCLKFFLYYVRFRHKKFWGFHTINSYFLFEFAFCLWLETYQRFGSQWILLRLSLIFETNVYILTNIKLDSVLNIFFLYNRGQCINFFMKIKMPIDNILRSCAYRYFNFLYIIITLILLN